jgi:hypothetical protein
MFKDSVQEGRLKWRRPLAYRFFELGYLLGRKIMGA